MKGTIENKLKKLPDEPGIYLFYNEKKECIYVGKATSLRSRVKSYFRGKTSPRPIEEMIHEVTNIEWKVADSVLEAVILESIYIKKFQPRYNVLGKDNKSWNYIVITNDEYPVVKTIRQHTLTKKLGGNATAAAVKELGLSKIFGPFPGLNAKETMKLLRRMFQFSDCGGFAKLRPPGASKRMPAGRSAAKPCFYYQIGECLGVCTGDISATEYKKKVIQPLTTFLNGGKKRLVKTLEGRMKKASKEEDFEEAARLRDQIARLQRIHDVALINKDFFVDTSVIARSRATLQSRRDSDALRARNDSIRVEGYDISNLGATGKVGAMVVFVDGEPDKSEYRKFKIKTVEGQSDVGSLEEVLMRRLQHAPSTTMKHGQTEETQNVASPHFKHSDAGKDIWPLPQLFLIDGGLPQVNIAKRILKEKGLDIPVVGIAKGPDRKKNEFILGSKKRNVILWVSENKELLVKVRDEAHRFALKYQRQTRKLK